MGDQEMFRTRADLHDRIYHWKDYAAEAGRVRACLAAAGIPDGARVVEGACGTGGHLAHLRKHYDHRPRDGPDFSGTLTFPATLLPPVPPKRFARARADARV